MTPTLYSHPFASFCQKVLIALYENGTPFEHHLVDLGDPPARESFLKLSPFGKMPALVDGGRVVTESSIIIEYLDRRHPGPAPMLPDDPDRALEVRAKDRFYDLYVADPMQKIVADRLRPEGADDPVGVEAARATLRTAYDLIEAEMAGRPWAAGSAFSMADCAAAPALFYADWVEPIGVRRLNTGAYLARLTARPSFARVIEDARPYRSLFPPPRPRA
ncbi:MAG TPA: glutathione S-transferase family protein [Phenylobacterium sp.]|nr:glutathione S-transferase family protein [Phenylobacterium sp.]